MLRYQELRWKEVRDDVAKLNPKLASIIDAIDPPDDYTFFKFKYRYGDEILQQSLLYLPYGDSLISIQDSRVDAHLKKNLSYNNFSNPASIVLNHALELFFTLEDRVIPFAVISPGSVIGLWRILDGATSYCPVSFIWGMTAGARSIFMLPKISESHSHTQLSRKYQLRFEKPRDYTDHWNIFKKMASHPEFEQPWETEVLFFNNKWFETIHDPSWEKLKLYFLEANWQASSYWRNQFTWDLIFSMVQKNRGIKPSPHLPPIIKHLLSIAVSALPGFQVATNDNFAPVSTIQKAYLETYQLKEYAPLIMQPTKLTVKDKNTAVYYSLQCPTEIQFSPKASNHTSNLTDLHQLHSLLKKYLAEIQKGDLNISGTPLDNIPNTVNFEFFHHEVQEYMDLKESADIPAADKVITEALGKFNGRSFPKKSFFFNGCVRISEKKK